MSITLQCGLSFIAGVLFGEALLYLIQYLNHRRNKARIKRELVEYYNSLAEEAGNVSDWGLPENWEWVDDGLSETETEE